MDNLDAKFIKKLIEEHEPKKKKMKELYDRYKGDYPILKKVKSPNKPNNKAVVNHDKLIVDTIVGYFAGVPITITHPDEKIQECLTDIFSENDKDELFEETAKQANIKGVAYWHIYQDEAGDTKVIKVPSEEVVLVTNRSTKEVDLAIRPYYIHDVESDKMLLCADVYDNSKIYYFIENERTGEFEMDYSKQNPSYHIFKRVPFVKIENNAEEMGEGEFIKSLNESFMKSVSTQLDEEEAYRKAYMIVKNMLTDENAMAKLREEGIISVGENGEVKFLTKDQSNVDGNLLLDRLEELIHKTSQVPNLNDENFASNLSGVAIRFKLFGLETKCITKERKFTKAIRELIKTIRPVVKVKTGKDIKISDISIQFTRNIPANLTEEIDSFVKLYSTGALDKETMISILSFIDDPNLVLEKLEKQEAEEYENLHDKTFDDA